MSDPKWFTETEESHSQWYAEHFRSLAAEGADLEGEARLVDAMVPRTSRILDAGCGQGRTSAALFARGHDVVAVDIDPILIMHARQDNPGPDYILGDLATLDLASFAQATPFAACVMAGNVITYVAPQTETAVLAAIRWHVVPDGFLVTGFHTERMSADDFEAHARDAGWIVEARFATWDLRAWRDDADFAVCILRNPA